MAHYTSVSPARRQGQSQNWHGDLPSTRSINEPSEHTVHSRSRSTAYVHSHTNSQSHSPMSRTVLTRRSRSNTTSSSFSRRSPSTSTTSDRSTRALDERVPSALGMRSETDRSRSLLSRGSRMLRRQGSKMNVVGTLDEADEINREHAPRSNTPTMFGRRSRRAYQHEQLKGTISDPFDFHHLTHTSPAQFQFLEQTRQNDLVTEFSVIRASQRPESVLKGIRADDIQFRNYSADDLPGFGTATTVDEPTPQSPPVSPSASSSASPTRHARRESRANENFSRPGSRFPRSCPTTPAPPVGADGSTQFDEPHSPAIDEILGLASARENSEYDESATSTPPQSTEEPGKALSRTGSISSHYDLEYVPEEQAATRYWDSPEASNESTHSPPASPKGPSQDNARSTRLLSPKAPLSIYVAKELSRKFSEALGSPTLPETALHMSSGGAVEGACSSMPDLHRSSYVDEEYDSWDADIDYCYEHAAESTSDFDWAHTALEDVQSPQVGMTCSNEPWLRAPRTRHLQPSPLSTSMLPTPDFDSDQARSSTSHCAPTPSTAEYERDFIHGRGGDYFQSVNSSIVPSTLAKQINQDSLYEDYLSTDAESDRHYPFPQGMMSQSENNLVSPRSSLSPISKCNSQESLMLSRAASIVRKHRSSVSTTSVPELIHSLSSSRELMPTDRMTAGDALAVGSRPASASRNRQTKSLAEAHLLLQAGSNATHPATDTAHPVATISHDRAKSTSAVDIHVEEQRPPVPPKNPNRLKQKSRTASYSTYSLFPTTAQ